VIGRRLHGDPALPVVPGHLDTPRAAASAAGDVSSAFLLVGIHVGSSVVKEPITDSDTRRSPMPTDPEIVDRLTNALQSALILAQRLAADVAQVLDAVAKASSAAHELRPDPSKRG